jgi:8-oxo-dGTP pyrophosphatase MutT (NUDIX family)
MQRLNSSPSLNHPTCRKVQVVAFCLNDSSSVPYVLQFQTTLTRGRFWQNMTGSLDEGESWEEGALREFYEETQIPVKELLHQLSCSILHFGLHKLDYFHCFEDRWKRQVEEHSFLFFFKMPEHLKPSITIDPSEHQFSRWLLCSEITPTHFHYASHYQVFREGEKYFQMLY